MPNQRERFSQKIVLRDFLLRSKSSVRKMVNGSSIRTSSVSGTGVAVNSILATWLDPTKSMLFPEESVTVIAKKNFSFSSFSELLVRYGRS